MGFNIQNTADAAINTGMGLLLEKHNDRRQLRQQEQLNRLQLNANKEQLNYQQGLALDMWDKTNYSAQVEQLKKAGMGVGLMYGKGGGGGASTTGAGSANVGGGGAPVGGGEIMGLQLMGAQKELVKAQTEKTKAETIKTAGVDTKLAEQNVRIQRNAADFATNAYEENYSQLLSMSAKLASEARIATQNADVGETTMDEKISQAEGELIGLGIANELKRKQTDLTAEQIKATAEAVQQKWAEIGVSKDRLKLDQFVKDVADSTKIAIEVASKVTSEIIEAVGRGRAATKMPKTTKERGWSEKNGEYWKTTERE